MPLILLISFIDKTNNLLSQKLILGFVLQNKINKCWEIMNPGNKKKG